MSQDGGWPQLGASSCRPKNSEPGFASSGLWKDSLTSAGSEESGSAGGFHAVDFVLIPQLAVYSCLRPGATRLAKCLGTNETRKPVV